MHSSSNKINIQSNMKFIIIEIILFIISNYYYIPKTTTTTDCANGDAMVGKRTWY